MFRVNEATISDHLDRYDKVEGDDDDGLRSSIQQLASKFQLAEVSLRTKERADFEFTAGELGADEACRTSPGVAFSTFCAKVMECK